MDSPGAEALQEGVCGFVTAATGAAVEVEGSLVHW